MIHEITTVELNTPASIHSVEEWQLDGCSVADAIRKRFKLKADAAFHEKKNGIQLRYNCCVGCQSFTIF